MNPTYDFRGQVALVTGASGAAIVLADINERALNAVTAEWNGPSMLERSVVPEFYERDACRLWQIS